MPYPPRLEIRLAFPDGTDIDLHRTRAGDAVVRGYGRRPVYTVAEGGTAIDAWPWTVPAFHTSLWIDDDDSGGWALDTDGQQHLFNVGRGVPPTVPDPNRSSPAPFTFAD